MILLLIISFIGGLAFLLLGIYFISKSLETYHFYRLKFYLSNFTNTPVKGFIFGSISTMLLQSSSAVTVLTISFVNARILTFNHAIGIILGTNVGTTFTTQIISFNLGDVWYYFLLIGTIFCFIPNHKIRSIGKALVSFAMILLGLNLMTWSTAPLQYNRLFISLWSKLDTSITYSVFVGLISTALLQSSSAVTAMLLAMAPHGYMCLTTAFAIVLGSNVGTCFTGVLAAIHSSHAARKVALAHILLNVGGLIIFLPLISVFVNIIELTSDSLPRQIANSHTVYNLVCSLIVLPFSSYFANLTSWVYMLVTGCRNHDL